MRGKIIMWENAALASEPTALPKPLEADFVEQVFLPWIRKHRSPSTFKSYSVYWKTYLKPVSIIRERRPSTKRIAAATWSEYCAPNIPTSTLMPGIVLGTFCVGETAVNEAAPEDGRLHSAQPAAKGAFLGLNAPFALSRKKGSGRSPQFPFKAYPTTMTARRIPGCAGSIRKYRSSM